MVDPIEGLAGVRNFGFTGADQLFKVPPKITAVWLSGVGGGGGISTQQNGGFTLYGAANCPLEVSPGDHIRVRVGGRPDIVAAHDEGVLPSRKLSPSGGWNGGGNGGGDWEGDPLGNPGALDGAGGGGATTFHLVPAGANPLSTLGDLVAVMPGEGGRVRNLPEMESLYRFIPSSGEWLNFGLLGYEPLDPFFAISPSAAFSFAGESPPAAEAAEYLGDASAYGYPGSTLAPPTVTPSTPTWFTLLDPWPQERDPSPTPPVYTGPQEISLGNPGESFRGGPGRRFPDGATTGGGGGGYGGGASGSRLFVTAEDTASTLIRIDIAMQARPGGFLLPIPRPSGWAGAVQRGETITTTELEGIEAPLLYLPGGGDQSDPFGFYNFTDTDRFTDTTDTMLGHGSARIQWARDPKRTKWRVGHVGWGRNNGW